MDKSGMDLIPGGKLYLDKNLRIIFGVTLTAVMGVASITPAFPKIIEEMGISARSVGLLITVFTMPGVILTPVLGILADHYGRKRVLIPSMFLFGIAGAACAFSRDFNTMLLLRLFQGIGAASLGSMNVTLIGDIFPGRQRTKAMGYNASVLSIGTASYPAIGGTLAMLGWNWPFFLPLLAIPMGFVVLFFLKNPVIINDERIIDQFKGALKSMMNRQVVVLFTASVTLFIILYGTCLTYIPILMAQAFNASSAQIGMIFTSMSFITAVISSQIGKISERFDERIIFRYSFLLYGFAVLLIPFMPGIGFMFIPMAIFGIGHGINIPCIQTLLAGLAPVEYRATFMSINGMVLRLGQTLGPLIMGVALTLWGIRGPFFAGAVFGLFMFFFGLIMKGEKRSKDINQ
ncbi:MAG: MFS transporter [Deltaproteobacteria bacterium]|nr:MFS transporter [Deltaproteobacteria bacterium]